MRRTFQIFAIAMLANLAAYGQSLGEIAREYREKQAAAQDSSGAQPRVITNKDLGEGPEGMPELRETENNVKADYHGPFDHHVADFGPESQGQRAEQQGAGENWKRQILMQQKRVANLQSRIDRLNASIHPGTAQYEGPYTRSQAFQLERLEQMQQQLAEQQRRLAEMQEAARHSGMHTTVYDP